MRRLNVRSALGPQRCPCGTKPSLSDVCRIVALVDCPLRDSKAGFVKSSYTLRVSSSKLATRWGDNRLNMKLIVIVTPLLLAVACGDQSETVALEPVPEPSVAKVEARALDQDVSLELFIEDADKSRPIVRGDTNLPDGTSLLVTVENAASGFRAQDDAVVGRGSFTAGPFGPSGGVAPGVYSAQVTMPLPRLQPDDVRLVIGESGENLSGALVHKTSGGIVVRAEQQFSVGSPAQVAKTERESNSEAEDLRRQIEKVISAGRAMESLRHSGDLSELKTCGEQMRMHQAEVQELRSRADALAHPEAFFLRVAAAEAHSCVSCLSSALEQCDQAQESLKEGARR